MNATNFIQTLESRTMFSTVAPPASDPGALVQNGREFQMEHQLPPGGGATVDTSNGTGSGSSTGTLSANARRRFSAELIRLD